jgi:signal peptidase II
LKKYFWDYAFLLGIAGFIVLVDQLTKYLVRTQLPFAGSWSAFVWLEPYIRIVHWQNTGAAFGMLQGFGFIFAILAVIVSIAILYYFPRVPSNEWAMRLAMAMQLGGAVGNLIDRITVGTVTDFVSVGTFAVFNVADACISVGTVILILAVWDSDRRQKKLAQANPEQDLASTDPPELPKQVEQTPASEKHPLE